ncbi:MAG: OmpA family protein [Bacteroidota bacterium]
MIKIQKYLFLVFCALYINSYSYAQNDIIVPLNNSCENPVYITDSVTKLILGQQFDKVWFKFKAKEENTFLHLFSENGSMHCDHLVFESTKNFCDSINLKKLIPLRNKVCDYDYDIDANTRLSYEAIHWGECLCSICCLNSNVLKTTQDKYYYVVVYGNLNSIQVGINSKKMTEEAAPEMVEYDPFTYFEIEVGKSIRLDDILFKSNQNKFLSESYTMLEKLAKFMKNNPTVTVEIQGHVNAPGEKSSLKSLKLSDSRADAVYWYLVESGIDKNRMTTKGYGNTKMIFPKAKTEAEFKKNRRVEVLITGV